MYSTLHADMLSGEDERDMTSREYPAIGALDEHDDISRVARKRHSNGRVAVVLRQPYFTQHRNLRSTFFLLLLLSPGMEFRGQNKSGWLRF